MSPSQGNSTSPGCAAQADEVVSLSAFLLGLGTVDSLHWAERGITLETGVSAWADQSGNGHDVANSTGGEQPLLIASVIGGKPALRYDGVDDFLTGSWTEAQPYHTLTVCVPSRSAVANKTIYDGFTNLTNMLDTGSGPGQLRMLNGLSLFVISTTDVGQLVTSLSDGASSSIQVNDGTPVTGDAGAADGDGVTFGVRGDQATNFGDCDLALRIVYTSITAPNLALAQAELSVHYSLGF